MDRESSGFDGSAMEGNAQLETAVLFLVFNRPLTTRAVFDTIRAARPRRLYVAADGPRPEVEDDPDRCADARRIATAIDWACELRTRFQERNVGLAIQVSSALDWFFENEAEGIILEDDCVPDPSFFRFCAELLDYYRETPAIMHISGDNFQYGRTRGRGSYFFSKYPFIWGWATWRRAWKLYDFRDASPEVQASTWDAQWLRAVEKNNGAAIVPNVNLVSNLGFGDDSTHTKRIEKYAMLSAHPMGFPLKHPPAVQIDRAADVLNYYVVYRSVRHLHFIWAYRMWDISYGFLRTTKKRILARWASARVLR
jgi:hypothetical protein